MFEDINLQRFADLFCPTCYEGRLDFINSSTEGVIFTTTDADCAKVDSRKIDLLLLKRFIERQ